MKNKILCLFTACLIIFSLFGFSSFAEEGQYMHIIYNDNDEALSGVTFRLYYLGSDSDGELQPDSVFDDYKCNFNISDAEKRKNLALTLEAYALRDNLPCYSETVTDENGFADFDGKMQAIDLTASVWPTQILECGQPPAGPDFAHLPAFRRPPQSRPGSLRGTGQLGCAA